MIIIKKHKINKMTSNQIITLERSFLERHTLEVAQHLLGKIIVANNIKYVITETEAYCHGDLASHCYDKKTERNKIMFGSVGHIYTYVIYGIHTCFNITAKNSDQLAGAVLIRGVVELNSLIKTNDIKAFPIDQKLNGPAKICSQLGITMDHYGKDLLDSSHDIYVTDSPIKIKTLSLTPRIGIKQATNELWRFVAMEYTYI